MGKVLQEFCKRGHLLSETRRRYGAIGTLCIACSKIHRAKHYAAYKEEYRQKRQQFYKANREKIIARSKSYQIRSYGIMPDHYKNMVRQQNGVCAICQREPQKRRLNIDHDHRDGHIRELLCGRCNRGLGLFNESAEILEAAARYMRKHSQLRLVS